MIESIECILDLLGLNRTKANYDLIYTKMIARTEIDSLEIGELINQGETFS